MYGVAVPYSAARADAEMVLGLAAEGGNVLALYELARMRELPNLLHAHLIDKERQAYPDNFLLRMAGAYLAHANKDEDGARRAAEEAVRARRQSPSMRFQCDPGEAAAELPASPAEGKSGPKYLRRLMLKGRR